MQLRQGTLLQGGKYRIECVLGQGGFGISYMAFQPGLGRKVAVKEFYMKEYCTRYDTNPVVSVPSSGSRELVDRFRQKFIKEAQMIATLNHPNVVRIYDIFEENGTAYYVMEYHDGGTLSAMISRYGRLNASNSVYYIRQVAEALTYLHARHMNHLDVKPANILLNSAGKAVLIDFGLSKRYDENGGQTSATPVGVSAGYSPMEQLNFGGVVEFSPPTDIYALGATLYKCVTGLTPPDSTQVFEYGLPALPPDVPAAIRDAIRLSMSPLRKDRPQSAAEFMALLDGGRTVPSPASPRAVAPYAPGAKAPYAGNQAAGRPFNEETVYGRSPQVQSGPQWQRQPYQANQPSDNGMKKNHWLYVGLAAVGSIIIYIIYFAIVW